MKKVTKRSDCPISRALDILGDKWTILILRDLSFRGFRFFKDYLNSGEGIATNVLSDRLKMLEEFGFIRSRTYEKNKTQKEYGLTEKGIELVPLILEMLAFGHQFDPSTEVISEFYNKYLANKEKVAHEVMSSLKNGEFKDFC